MDDSKLMQYLMQVYRDISIPIDVHVFVRNLIRKISNGEFDKPENP